MYYVLNTLVWIVYTFNNLVIQGTVKENKKKNSEAFEEFKGSLKQWSGKVRDCH